MKGKSLHFSGVYGEHFASMLLLNFEETETKPVGTALPSLPKLVATATKSDRAMDAKLGIRVLIVLSPDMTHSFSFYKLLWARRHWSTASTRRRWVVRSLHGLAARFFGNVK